MLAPEIVIGKHSNSWSHPGYECSTCLQWNLRQLNTALWYVILNRVFNLHIKEKAGFSELLFLLGFPFPSFPSLLLCMHTWFCLCADTYVCLCMAPVCPGMYRSKEVWAEILPVLFCLVQWGGGWVKPRQSLVLWATMLWGSPSSVSQSWIAGRPVITWQLCGYLKNTNSSSHSCVANALTTDPFSAFCHKRSLTASGLEPSQIWVWYLIA